VLLEIISTLILVFYSRIATKVKEEEILLAYSITKIYGTTKLYITM